jgi:hypothetical protein
LRPLPGIDGIRALRAMLKYALRQHGLRPLPGIDGIRALRAMLKYALRQHGLRCIAAHEEPTTDPKERAREVGQNKYRKRPMNITCKSFRPFHRNTLRGFAEIEILDINLRVRDVALHEKNASRWAQLPAKPQINKDGIVVKDAGGKAQYVHILEFDSRDRRDEFNAAVIAAVIEHDPAAFDIAPF